MVSKVKKTLYLASFFYASSGPVDILFGFSPELQEFNTETVHNSLRIPVLY